MQPAAGAAFARLAGPSRGLAASAAAAAPEPHGGKLVDRMVGAAEKEAVLAKAAGKTIELSDRNACDLELISVGGFSPVDSFMTEEEYDHVVENHRLKDSNLLFGLPVVLDTDSEDLKVRQGQCADLARPTPAPLAVMRNFSCTAGGSCSPSKRPAGGTRAARFSRGAGHYAVDEVLVLL